jgi:hypothetical protein
VNRSINGDTSIKRYQNYLLEAKILVVLSGFPLQNLAFQGGDIVAAKTCIIEKT